MFVKGCPKFVKDTGHLGRIRVSKHLIAEDTDSIFEARIHDRDCTYEYATSSIP